MHSRLTWLADTFGGFSAAFFVYLTAGGVAGRLLARDSSYPLLRDCWPETSMGSVFAFCDSALANAFWYITVGFPSTALFFLRSSMYVIWMPPVTEFSYPSNYAVVNELTLTMMTSITSLLLIVGFLALRTRSTTLAWIIAFALLAQIAEPFIRLALR